MLKIVIVDASAMVEYLLRTRQSVVIEGVITDSDSDVHVPALCDIEVCSALRRLLLQRKLSTERAEEALEDYRDLPLVHHGHQTLMDRILQLHANFSAYDAAYVALAERLKGAFLTGDKSLERAVSRYCPDIEIAR